MNRIALDHNSSGQPQKDSVAFGLGGIVAVNRKMDKLILPPTSTSQAHPTSTLSGRSGDYHTCVYAPSQEAANNERKEERKAQRAACQKEKGDSKAHDRAKYLSSKAMDKIAPLLTSLLPKVVNPTNEETVEFKQLPLLMKTQLKAALNDLQAINTIASECKSGIRRDVEFDFEYVKASTTKAEQLLKALAQLGEAV